MCLNNASSRTPSGGAYDTNLARLMLGGWHDPPRRQGPAGRLPADHHLGISYVSARYVGLGDLLLGAGYVVTADFDESGGIFENAEVTYRGVAVGRVDRLRLADDGVHVDLRIDSGVEVPKDTMAVVENRSAVGEQYVDLQPRTQGGPFLAAGDRIDDDATPHPAAHRGRCCSTWTAW